MKRLLVPAALALAALGPVHAADIKPGVLPETVVSALAPGIEALRKTLPPAYDIRPLGYIMAIAAGYWWGLAYPATDLVGDGGRGKSNIVGAL